MVIVMNLYKEMIMKKECLTFLMLSYTARNMNAYNFCKTTNISVLIILVILANGIKMLILISTKLIMHQI